MVAIPWSTIFRVCVAIIVVSLLPFEHFAKLLHHLSFEGMAAENTWVASVFEAVVSFQDFLAHMFEELALLQGYFMRIRTLVSLAYYIAIFIIVRALYHFFFTPLILFKTMDQVEKEILNRNTTTAEIRTRKQPGKTPPPYPNGWFRILSSFQLKPGQAIDVDVLGRRLVVFRGTDGKAAVLDAHCPHLGANLGVGGRVVDNCIECPFHGWRFSGVDGQCTHIPYIEGKVPSVARTYAYPVMEMHGHIYFYNDSERAQPTWRPPVLKEITSGKFYFHGTTEHYVGAHIQEIPENGADVAHLNVLHLPFIVNMFSSVLQHRWSASWRPGEEGNGEAHLGHVSLSQSILFLGKTIPGTSFHANITQVGPGIVNLFLDLPVGRVFVIETITPVAPFVQKASHTVWAEWRVPRFIGKLVLRALTIQFERDIPIWSNKTYLPTPLVVKGDGSIKQFRRWFSRFYPKTAELEIREEGESSTVEKRAGGCGTDVAW